MNEEPFRALTALFRERLRVISDLTFRDSDPEAHLQALGDVSLRIEAAVAALPTPLDPTLEHYLERRSYDKALAFIEDALGKEDSK